MIIAKAFFLFLFFFGLMTTSHFGEVTDEEINCFKENAYFSNN